MIVPGGNYPGHKVNRTNQSMEDLRPLDIKDHSEGEHKIFHTEGNIDPHDGNMQQLDNVLDSIADQ